jgi:DeoR/GlpR family transcriptional regulator of sugar metabolism
MPAAQAPYEERTSLNTGGKARVAAAAAKLIQPGMTVVIDGGTTAPQVARELPSDLVATVVTRSPTVAVELLGKTNIETVLVGAGSSGTRRSRRALPLWSSRCASTPTCPSGESPA